MAIRRLIFAVVLITAGCDPGPGGPSPDVTPPAIRELSGLQAGDSVHVMGTLADSVGVVRVHYRYLGRDIAVPVQPDTLVQFSFRVARPAEDVEIALEACDAAGNCVSAPLRLSEPFPVEVWARGARVRDTVDVHEDTLTLRFVARSVRGVERIEIQRDFETKQTFTFAGDTVAAASLPLAVPPGTVRVTATMYRRGGGQSLSSAVVRRSGIRFSSIARECAVGREDHLLYCWFSSLGSNAYDYGHLTVVPLPTPSPVVEVARGADGGPAAGCALVREGSVYCWTDENYLLSGPRITRVAADQPFSRITAAPDHGCALTSLGEAYCWTMASYGPIGPARAVATSLRFRGLSAGTGFICGITIEGDAACWGANEEGQLGDGSRLSHESPVPVAGGLKFVAISAGRSHACGVSAENLAYCWGGTNPLGQLGGGPSNTATRITTPRLVTRDLRFQEVSVGATHSCALTLDGTIHCWGDNSYGQLGVGPLPALSPAPLAVESPERFRDLAASGAFTCAATVDDRVACWGDPRYASAPSSMATPRFPVGQ
jgi:hypothetical protein